MYFERHLRDGRVYLDRRLVNTVAYLAILTKACVDLGANLHLSLVLGRLVIIGQSLAVASAPPRRLHILTLFLIDFLLLAKSITLCYFFTRTKVIMQILRHVKHPFVIGHLLVNLQHCLLIGRILFTHLCNHRVY